MIILCIGSEMCVLLHLLGWLFLNQEIHWRRMLCFFLCPWEEIRVSGFWGKMPLTECEDTDDLKPVLQMLVVSTGWESAKHSNWRLGSWPIVTTATVVCSNWCICIMASLSGYPSPPPSSLLPLFTPFNSLQPSCQLKQSRGFQFEQWLILYKCGYGKKGGERKLAKQSICTTHVAGA